MGGKISAVVKTIRSNDSLVIVQPSRMDDNAPIASAPPLSNLSVSGQRPPTSSPIAILASASVPVPTPVPTPVPLPESMDGRKEERNEEGEEREEEQGDFGFRAKFPPDTRLVMMGRRLQFCLDARAKREENTNTGWRTDAWVHVVERCISLEICPFGPDIERAESGPSGGEEEKREEVPPQKSIQVRYEFVRGYLDTSAQESLFLNFVYQKGCDHDLYGHYSTSTFMEWYYGTPEQRLRIVERFYIDLYECMRDIFLHFRERTSHYAAWHLSMATPEHEIKIGDRYRNQVASIVCRAIVASSCCGVWRGGGTMFKPVN